MTDDGDEDLLVLGPDRPAGVARWITALALAVLLAGGALLALSRSSHSSAKNHTRPSAPASDPASVLEEEPVRRPTTVDDEYLVEVPSTDMRAALTTASCRAGCTAVDLDDRGLTRAAGAFPGFRPLAGGLVTAHGGRAVLQSIEGRAQPDALVHLVADRTAQPASPGVFVSNTAGDGFRSVRVWMVRGGWRFDATLVVRGTPAPVDAAAQWARGAPLPG